MVQVFKPSTPTTHDEYRHVVSDLVGDSHLSPLVRHLTGAGLTRRLRVCILALNGRRMRRQERRGLRPAQHTRRRVADILADRLAVRRGRGHQAPARAS